MNKVLLYYNPKSGNGIIATHLDEIIRAFQRRGKLIVPLRADRVDILDRFIKKIDVEEYEKIVVAGGDGTINTLVNALLKYDLHIPIAVFPTGTANDFAFHFDLPSDIDQMIAVALSDNYETCDVGLAGDKPFINVLAMGMLVDVSQKTDPLVKNTLGVLAYYLRGAAEIPNLKPIPIKVTTDEEVIETDMFAMLIMNGRSAGGFNKLAPDASINDGLLDVILIKKIPIMEFAAFMFGVMIGQITDNKYVYHFKTDHMYIESPTEVIIDTDGESGGRLPVEVNVLKERLKINVDAANQKDGEK
ncbi:MAG: YegS/Rv2252/BmrU family lipid kinase [Clostridiales Family XIII bacterium]|jgi:YegS/Rv2252/BmrU family lipid kinase|nr:YegS/Rv2252/BmrU family lipid kinase [Clostridiales Family XIII bacterium]